jgi:hypothetical protein
MWLLGSFHVIQTRNNISRADSDEFDQKTCKLFQRNKKYSSFELNTTMEDKTIECACIFIFFSETDNNGSNDEQDINACIMYQYSWP